MPVEPATTADAILQLVAEPRAQHDDTHSPVLPEGSLHILRGLFEMAPSPPSEAGLWALALTFLSVQLGHTCLEIEDLKNFGGSRLPYALAERSPENWIVDLSVDSLVTVVNDASAELRTSTPLVLDHGRLYLQRYFEMERLIASFLLSSPPPATLEIDAELLDDALRSLFGPNVLDIQRQAAQSIVERSISVIAGGPGTGKTTTVAKAIVAMSIAGANPVIRLAAPTGKAAQRMRESLKEVVGSLPGITSDVVERIGAMEAVTLHSLLGLHAAAVHRRSDDPIPADIIICDETSMTALPLLAELFRSVGRSTRIVLVGDPAQLRSVDVGTVMDDLVGPIQIGESTQRGQIAVTVLDRSHRAVDPTLLDLFDAIRRGNEDRALELLAGSSEAVDWIAIPDGANEDVVDDLVASSLDCVVQNAKVIRSAARSGNVTAGLMSEVKVLTATHRGILGRIWWSDAVAAALDVRLGSLPDRVGVPVLVTKNDRPNRLWNGDTGVVVEREGRRGVLIDPGDHERFLSPTSLSEWLPWWAMTIHKSQGSEFQHVIISLPPDGTRVLSRELLYTGLTRAKAKVTVLANETVLRSAINQPVTRSSGLRERIWRSPQDYASGQFLTP